MNGEKETDKWIRNEEISNSNSENVSDIKADALAKDYNFVGDSKVQTADEILAEIINPTIKEG